MTTEKKDQGKKGTFTFKGFLPQDHPLFGSGPVVSGRPMAGVADLGFLPPDHPVYSRGPVVAGRTLSTPPEHGTVQVIARGYLPPDHPIYSRGPMIYGRPDPDPPKKKKKKKKND